jgi:hypothetical protein
LKGIPNWLAVVLTLVGGVGCEREVPFVVPPPVPINGYQIEGYVTDRLGIPVKNLPIALWYEFDYLDGNPPNRLFYVDNSNETSLVRVIDAKKNVKRVLFQGRAPLGPLDVSWDKKDSLGQPVPTGIYTVDFRQGGVPKNSYTRVVNGNVTVVTDSLGHYTITNDQLPVGFYPVPLYGNDDSSFLGNFQVSSYVVLEFYLTSHRSASVTLTPDQVSRLDYRI